MSVRYADQTTTRISGVDVPLPGVTIYVYSTDTAQLATLTADGGGALSNPFTSDALGNYAINVATAGLYDLAFYVGGKQVFRENGVYIGTGDRLTALVQAIIATTPLTVNVVTGTTPFSYSTRGGIIGITSTTIGQRVLLTENGRLGWFELKSGNYAALVTADTTYQGLYLPHATLATSAAAWVRDVPGSVYLGTWWGAGASFGVNNHLPLQSALDLVPPGSTVMAPNESFTVSGSVILRQTGLKLLGAGATEFIHNAATSAFPVIQPARSDCEVAFMTVTGKPSNLSAANPSCIIVSHNGTGYSGGLTPITNLKVHDVHCRNSSLPISTFGMPIAGVGVSPVSGLDIYNVVLETNALGIEIMNSDNVDFHDFRISYFESVSVHNGANTVLPGIRILGSKTVRVHDGQADGFDAPSATHEGLRFSAANSDGTATGRRSNQDCIVERVKFTNFYGAVTVGECRGDCIVRQCSFWRDPTDTTAMCDAIITDANVTSFGMAQKVGRFIFEDNNVTGWSRFIFYGGSFGHILIKNNTWLGNGATVSGANYLIAYNVAGGVKLTEFVNNSFIAPAGVGFTITAGSGETVRVFGNTMIEGGATETAIANGFANIGTSTGAGTFLASNNWTYPVGTRAARIAYGDLT